MSHLITANHDQIFLLPPSLEDWVPPEHPARFVRDFVRALPLPELGICIPPPQQGHPSYHPELLLSLWLYGYLQRVRTSRKVEIACTQDLGFIWLAGNRHPDHNTLARFFKTNCPVIKTLFKTLVKTAHRLELIGMVLHALDGTKIPSACGKHGALHQDALHAAMASLDTKIDAMLAATLDADAQPSASVALPAELCDAQARRAAIAEQLSRLAAEETHHLQPTEPDARMQKCADGKARFGYNCQAVRDERSGFIVAEEVTNEVVDTHQFTPMLDETQDNLGETAEATDADGGYAAGEEIMNAEAKGYNILLNLAGLAGNARYKGKFPKRDFQYDAVRDCYICPQGEPLPFAHTKRTERQAGREVFDVRVYQGKTCATCPLRAQCTDSKHGRRVERSPYDEAIERQIARQDTMENTLLLKMRSQIIEPLFAFIKDSGGFRRFTHRGLSGARAQWSMVCLTHNLKTLARFWHAGRFTWEEFKTAIRQVLQEDAKQPA